MDLLQSVRYRGRTREQAIARWKADLPRAREAGFQPQGEGRWMPRRSAPVLVVDYLYCPPAKLTRVVRTAADRTGEDFAADAGAMALAGYIPLKQTWRGTDFNPGAAFFIGTQASYGWSAHAVLTIDYRFDPELAGEPVAPIPALGGDGGWWVFEPS